MFANNATHSGHVPTCTEVVAEDDGGGAIAVAAFDVQVKLTNQALSASPGPVMLGPCLSAHLTTNSNILLLGFLYDSA